MSGAAEQPALPDLREAGIAAAALLLLMLIAFRHAAGGGVLGWEFGDLAASYFHWRQWGFAQIASGRFPFWNPHTFCGAPFAANYETALFYPLNLIYLIVPTIAAINLSYLFHLWFAGFGAWLLARRWLGDPFAAAIPAIVMMFSGPMLGRVFAGHLTIVSAGAWLPWLLLLTELILTHRSWKLVSLFAAAFGLQALAGHPQITYYTTLLIGIYTFLRVCQEKPRRQGIYTIGKVALGGLLGTGLAAVQILLTAAMQAYGSRETMSIEGAGTYSLFPSNFAALLAPRLFGGGAANPELGPYWGPWYSWEIAVYCGVPTVLLAILAIPFLVYREGLRLFRKPIFVYTMLGGICAIIALGAKTPLFTAAYTILPGFDFFRGHSKILLHGSLLLSLIAARGALCLKEISFKQQGILHAALLAASVLILLLVTSESAVQWMIDQYASAGTILEIPAAALTMPDLITIITTSAGSAFLYAFFTLLISLAVLLSAALNTPYRFLPLAIFLAIDTISFNSRFIAYHDPGAAPQIPVLQQHRLWIDDPAISPNRALQTGSLSLTGYEPVYPSGFGRYINAMNGRDYDFYTPLPEPNGVTPHLDAAAARRWEPGKPVGDLIDSPPARFRFLTNWQSAESPRQAWELFREKPGEAVIETSLKPIENAAPSARVAVDVQKQNLTIEIESDSPGMVYIADTWFPGWQATVNGEPAEIYRANVNFRAVYIENAGQSIVEMRYWPEGFTNGLIISLLSLAGIAGLAFIPSPKMPMPVPESSSSDSAPDTPSV